MRQAHTVEQVRTAEAELMARLPEGTLMRRAAAGLAYAVLDLLGTAYGRRVTLLVGAGDNGGDALYAGSLLARRGVRVEAVLLSPERAHRGGLAALRAAGADAREPSPTAPHERTGPPAMPDLVIDGIVGIGARGPLRADAQAALAAYDGVPVVAVDVPSGVDVDTGEVAGPHVSATLTVTFGTHKIAHLVEPAASACGAVHLVDIGLTGLPAAPVTALQPTDVARLLPRPTPDAHKYTRGVVGVRTGSTRYPGAAVLSVAGAGCGLAGMVRYDGSAATEVQRAHPEVVAGPGQVQAWVVGSGGGETAGQALADSLADGVPVVADADALAHVRGPVTGELVVTPHAGELARMLGVDRAEVESRQLHHARAAAERFAATVLLKGPHTLVASPDGRVRVTTSGTPWLATAGAGDVLAGLVGALLAAGLSAYDAASVGSWLHGAAATLAAGDGPLTAGAVAAAIPAAVRGLPGTT